MVYYYFIFLICFAVFLVLLTRSSTLSKNVPSNLKFYFDSPCSKNQTGVYSVDQQYYEFPNFSQQCQILYNQFVNADLDEKNLLQVITYNNITYYIPFDQVGYYGSTSFPFSGPLTDFSAVLAVEGRQAIISLYYNDTIDGTWSIPN